MSPKKAMQLAALLLAAGFGPRWADVRAQGAKEGPQQPDPNRPKLVVQPDGERARGIHPVVTGREGKWMVVATIDPGGQVENTAHLWDLTTGKRLFSFERTTDRYTTAVSDDGKWLVTGDKNNARLLEVPTGKEVRQFTGHTERVVAV